MKRDFEEWLKTFTISIAEFDYYTDFQKVYNNINKIKIELNILNSLIGSPNIEEEFEEIVKQYPNVLKCIPLLLAIREKEKAIYAGHNGDVKKYTFEKPDCSLNDYKIFMSETGLFDLLQNHIINNLTDYAMGVETGLDSNARKNRGGHQMENLVESFLQKAGFVNNVTYFKEMYSDDVTSHWGVNLAPITNNFKTRKRFDFVVKTEKCVYLIETNFYTSGGSKLNETARSYENIAREIKNVEGAKFVWFTDGAGWHTAKQNLEETFDVLDDIYNINDMKNGIMKEIFI